MLRAEGAARTLYGGQAPEVVEHQALQAGSSVVSAVIARQLGRGDPEGLALFRQYADRLDPRERRTLGAAAEMLTHTIAAADWLRARSATLAAAPAPTGDAALDAVNAASTGAGEPPPVTSWSGRLLDREGIVGHRERLAAIEERRRALTALNAQEFAADPVRLRANRTAIGTDAARDRAAAKAESDKAYAELQAYLTTGGPGGGPAVTLPPATILSRFTAEQQEAVAAQVNRAIEGRKTRTDQPTWYVIHQGLTGDDANERERWADANLVQFQGQLSDDDFAALTSLQATMRSNDGGAEASRQVAITRMANRALLAAGIDPTPRPDTDGTQPETFRRALNDELSTFESSKGRPATTMDAQYIIHRLEAAAVKLGGLRVSDRNAAVTKGFDAQALLTGQRFPNTGRLNKRLSEEQERPQTTPDLDDLVNQPHVHLAQSVVPFLAKPPSYPVNPRPNLRYKEPIPGLSGKEKGNDIPRGFEGKRPLVGESGRQAAERALNEKYGKDQ